VVFCLPFSRVLANAKKYGKRIVFIVDEAHRSTFGDMLITIKTTFPKAIFFGFTGTPIQDENQKKKNTTTTVFGNELLVKMLTHGNIHTERRRFLRLLTNFLSFAYFPIE